MGSIKDENKLICKEHSNQEIVFIQVNETLNLRDNKNIFYCTLCVKEDLNLKYSNFQLTSKIIG